MAIEEDPPAGVPEWVVTYGDMMSLLLTFFIMLVSMSKLKEEGAMRAMLDAIRQTFGPSVGDAGVPGPSLRSNSVFNKLSSLGMRAEGGLKKQSWQGPGPGGPNSPVASIGEGSVVTLGGPGMFHRFEATLTSSLKSQLDLIVDVIESRPNRIDVRGHTSPEPLPDGSPFRDSWDLSFARAYAVAEYLISRGIDRQRILISAAGDVEPRKVTRDPEGQMLNHRVDVFVIDSYITPPETADPAEPRAGSIPSQPTAIPVPAGK